MQRATCPRRALRTAHPPARRSSCAAPARAGRDGRTRKRACVRLSLVAANVAATRGGSATGQSHTARATSSVRRVDEPEMLALVTLARWRRSGRSTSGSAAPRDTAAPRGRWRAPRRRKRPTPARPSTDRCPQTRCARPRRAAPAPAVRVRAARVLRAMAPRLPRAARVPRRARRPARTHPEACAAARRGRKAPGTHTSSRRTGTRSRMRRSPCTGAARRRHGRRRRGSRASSTRRCIACSPSSASGCAHRSTACTRNTSAFRTRRPRARFRRPLSPAQRIVTWREVTLRRLVLREPPCRLQVEHRVEARAARRVAAVEIDRTDGAASDHAGAVVLAAIEIDLEVPRRSHARGRRSRRRCSACRHRGRSGFPASTARRTRPASHRAASVGRKRRGSCALPADPSRTSDCVDSTVTDNAGESASAQLQRRCERADDQQLSFRLVADRRHGLGVRQRGSREQRCDLGRAPRRFGRPSGRLADVDEADRRAPPALVRDVAQQALLPACMRRPCRPMRASRTRLRPSGTSPCARAGRQRLSHARARRDRAASSVARAERDVLVGDAHVRLVAGFAAATFAVRIDGRCRVGLADSHR